MRVKHCGKRVFWRIHGGGLQPVYMCQRHATSKEISRYVDLGILKREESNEECAGCEVDVKTSKEFEGATPG